MPETTSSCCTKPIPANTPYRYLHFRCGHVGTIGQRCLTCPPFDVPRPVCAEPSPDALHQKPLEETDVVSPLRGLLIGVFLGLVFSSLIIFVLEQLW